MKRVSHADFVRKFSAYCDEALAEPIVLTRNGRDRLLVVSVDKYKQLLSLAILNAKDEASVEECVEEMGNLLGRTGTSND